MRILIELPEVVTAMTTEIEQNGHVLGQYTRILDQDAKDKPCPDCETPIEKISYLGGSCSLCPTCQM